MTTNRKPGSKKEVDINSVVYDMVNLARDQKVLRLKVGDIEIEMHPDAFKNPPSIAKPITAIQMKLEGEKRAREEEDLLYGSV